MKLPEENLSLNFFEIGYLTAMLTNESWEKMPRSLWLKLKIISTKAYLQHPIVGIRAKKDISMWEKELSKL